MQTSQRGENLIKFYEGLRLTVYRDAIGLFTIGWGHKLTAYNLQTIDLAKAEELLQSDLRRAESSVMRLTDGSCQLTQGQFDALVSFVFNIGSGSLAVSTLLKKLRAGDISGAADEFGRWNHAGSQVLPGLTERRLAERDLFLDMPEAQAVG